ncbi:MAG: ABC transporter ATP-binding protein [Oscillospiraceae bacterium]|nr:ABC transporter ATP-binding protein [Oscillospiraceae bacterium]
MIFGRKSSEILLEARGLSRRFGGLLAVDNISFSLQKGENIAFAGANGAGKTSLFDLLTGFSHPTEGEILIREQRMPSDPVSFVRAGVARTFQNLQLFPDQTVKEQLQTAYLACNKRGPKTSELLHLAGLWKERDRSVLSIPYGSQKICELLRALATGADLIFLDEPAAGMNQWEKEQFILLLQKLKGRYGVQFAIIEHDISFLSALCPRVLILERGRLLADGPPENIFSLPKVRASFLGKG